MAEFPIWEAGNIRRNGARGGVGESSRRKMAGCGRVKRSRGVPPVTGAAQFLENSCKTP
jgi:hypothetical protein